MSSSKHSSKRHSLNSIESSVTRLLVSTKHLLESLTQWARQEVDDKYVSDAYVKLGNDFRAASRAFTQAGIDISDIGDVPQALRIILEAALSEAPSQGNLDRFLPNIRNIIVTLLQNLKAKQGKARSLSSEKSNDKSNPDRIIVEKQRSKSPEKQPTTNQSNNRDNSLQSILHNLHKKSDQSQEDLNDRQFARSDRTSKPFKPSGTNEPSQEQPPVDNSSSTSSSQISEPHSGSRMSSVNHQPKGKENIDVGGQDDVPLAEQDALLQLQNENVLQRRASKRFSAYQYAKLANINPSSGLPSVPSPDAKRVPLAQAIRDSIKERSPRRSQPEPTDENNEAYVFLKVDNHTKKAPIKTPVSFASLRLLFVEKFAYSPGSTDFPAIYIVDPKSGVSYELEDQYLSDVKDGTLLSLNENKLNDKLGLVNKSSDDYANGTSDSINLEENSRWKELEQVVFTLRDKFETFDDLITGAIKDGFKNLEIPFIPQQQPTPTSAGVDSNETSKSISKEEATPSSVVPHEIMKEVDSIENELKVVRQLQKTNKGCIESFVTELNSKVSQLQSTAVDASMSSNRVYMEKCHSKLSEESDSLLTKVDDLQDIMEALRKDVAQRGVRVSDQQLKLTVKEINEAHRALQQMSSYISNEKGVWKKIWEAELDKVCEEQQFFNLQDDLTKDLEEDISKIRETFDLIEQCSLEQSKQSNHRRNKVVANLYIPEPGENLNNIKDAVLNEVVALRPDHQSRVDAINRAERLREKEREMMRLTKFQQELGTFVDDSKLKKSGGIEELERQRQLKDSENLKMSLGGV